MKPRRPPPSAEAVYSFKHKSNNQTLMSLRGLSNLLKRFIFCVCNEPSVPLNVWLAAHTDCVRQRHGPTWSAQAEVRYQAAKMEQQLERKSIIVWKRFYNTFRKRKKKMLCRTCTHFVNIPRFGVIYRVRLLQLWSGARSACSVTSTIHVSSWTENRTFPTDLQEEICVKTKRVGGSTLLCVLRINENLSVESRLLQWTRIDYVYKCSVYFQLRCACQPTFKLWNVNLRVD